MVSIQVENIKLAELNYLEMEPYTKEVLKEPR